MIDVRYETGVAESWLSGKGLAAVSTIERIREKIRARDNYFSSHAEEEMDEDAFERPDWKMRSRADSSTALYTVNPQGLAQYVVTNRPRP